MSLSDISEERRLQENARGRSEAMDVDGAPSKPLNDSQRQCGCVIHRTFSGYLRSDVSCQACKATSTAIDPFFDISLDISGPLGSSTGMPFPGGVIPDMTITDCLKKYASLLFLSPCSGEHELSLASLFLRFVRFTRPEVLDNYTCDHCKSLNKSYKQLSMRTLPVVIVFHLKRFKQISLTSSKSTKIDTYVEFPVTLDMADFSSVSIRGYVIAIQVLYPLH
jgi:ubiquitin carboxyl-terminal hydrolase 22/27/51